MTFGVSAKESDNPFGRFGTGLKYAVAILLRTGHRVTCYSDGEEYKFDLAALDFRGQEFQRITMNGEALGFTTHLGDHWELWMAYRELYCNAMDEPDGSVVAGEPVLFLGHPRLPVSTHWVVEGPGIADVHMGRAQWFIDQNTPVHRLGNGVDLYNAITPGIYLKGVLIHGFGQPAKWSYNLQELSGVALSEDRELKALYYAEIYICKAILKTSNAEAVTEFLSYPAGVNPADYFEADMPISDGMWGETFKGVAQKVMSNPHLQVSEGHRATIREKGITAGIASYTPTSIQLRMYDQAIAFLDEALGLTIPEDVPVVFVKDLGTGVHAQANLRTRTITVGRECFNQGKRYLASTMMEEIIHLNTGYRDCTRDLQTYLFDKLIGMGEELVGEPL